MSAGAGHKRAAQALFFSCQQNYPEIEAKNIDLLDYSTWFFKKTTASLYHFLAQYLPTLYGLAYKGTDYSVFAKLLYKMSVLLEINNTRLHDFIADFNPDLIIATHFLVPAVVKNSALQIPMDMLITDYGLHGFWLAPNIRHFYVATPEMSEGLKKMDCSAFATGLPVHPEFLVEKNIDFLKAKFNLTPGWKTVLSVSGGFGLKDNSSLINKLATTMPQTNLIVISGKDNDLLFQKYIKILPSQNCNYQIIKFTEEIDELMRVADVIITKPGGITLTECAWLNKKIILTEPIPGQEEANESYFIKNKLAIKLDDADPIQTITKYLGTPYVSPRPKPFPNDLILERALKNSP